MRSNRKQKPDNYVTEKKKIINAHIPGHQKRQTVASAKNAEFKKKKSPMKSKASARAKDEQMIKVLQERED